MPELPCEFEVYCAKCGAGLCMNCTEGRTRGRGMPFINVTPCETCADRENEKGYEDGYSKGWDEAMAVRDKAEVGS